MDTSSAAVLLKACEFADSKQAVEDALKALPSKSFTNEPVFALLRNQHLSAETMCELLNLLGSVNEADPQTGLFPIHAAAKYPKHALQLVEHIFKTDQDMVKLQSQREGNTVLHLACECAQADLVSHLQLSLSHEAFVELIRVRNNKGMLCLDMLFPHPIRPFDVLPSSSSSSNNMEDLQQRLKIHSLLQQSDPYLVPLVFYHPDCLEHLPAAMGNDDDAMTIAEDGETTTSTPEPLLPQADEEMATRSTVSFKKAKTQAAAAEDNEEPWEGPTRLKSIMENLKPLISEGKVTVVNTFPECERELVETVHSSKYVDFVYGLASNSRVNAGRPVHFSPLLVKAFDLDLDSVPKDTFFSKGSLQAATRAAGSVVAAVDAVCFDKSTRKAMCIVRPPGHHAGIEGIVPGATSCGFCIFNNVMIGVQHYLHLYEDGDQTPRVAIVDIDVHHGNGTEEIIQKYYEDHPPTTNPSPLLFMSTHLHDHRPSKCDFYPGGEFGKQDDLVRNVINLPIRPRWRWKLDAVLHPKTWQDKFYSYHLGRSAFRKMIVERVLPTLRAFQPDLLIVSAGFDTANGDAGNCDLGGSEEDGHAVGLDLEREDFHWVSNALSKFADEYCGGKMISVLEGGYGRLDRVTGDVDRALLGRNVQSFVNGICGLNFTPNAEFDPELPLYFDTAEFFTAPSSNNAVEQPAPAAETSYKEEQDDEALGKEAAKYWAQIYDADPVCYAKLINVLQLEFTSLNQVLDQIKAIFMQSSKAAPLLQGFNQFLPASAQF